MQKLPIIPTLIGVAQFRMKMKDYISQVSRKGFILCTGAHGEALIMSDETLKQLEMRHAFNLWARKAYCYMDLNSVRVLSCGTKTKDLPVEFQHQLTYFFQFVYDVMDYAVKETVASHLASYDISTAVYDAVFDRTSFPSSIRFGNYINVIINELFVPEVFKTFEDFTNPDKTIYITQFLDRLGSVSFDEWHGVRDSRYLKCEDLTDKQRMMVSEMIHQFTVWAKLVIWNQPLDIDFYVSYAKQAEIQYEELKKIYEKYIGELPPISFFPL